MSDDPILETLKANPPRGESQGLSKRRAELLDRAAVVRDGDRAEHRRRLRWGWVALAALGVAASRLVPESAPRPPEPEVVVIATADARYTRDHSVVNGRSTERIHLGDGRLEVSVPADRDFSLETDDASLEASGRFIAVSEDGALSSVEVLEGAAMVRPKTGEARLISLGHRWSPEPKPAAPEEIATPVRAPLRPRSAPAPERRSRPEARAIEPDGLATTAPVVAPVSAPTLRPQPTKAELAFAAGWRAFQARRFDEAVLKFGEASEDQGAIGEDAAYWHARSLLDAGRRAESTRSLLAFVERFPFSPRADEAHLLAGAQLLDDGRVEEARAHLEAAARSPRAAIRDPARARLEALRPD